MTRKIKILLGIFALLCIIRVIGIILGKDGLYNQIVLKVIMVLFPIVLICLIWLAILYLKKSKEN